MNWLRCWIGVAACAFCVCTALAQVDRFDRPWSDHDRTQLGGLLLEIGWRGDGPQDLAYDFNGDGIVTPADYSAWLVAFNDRMEQQPPTNPEPPSGGPSDLPEQWTSRAWWPKADAPAFEVASARELALAAEALQAVGGFLTLETPEAASALVDRLSTGGGLAGTPERRIVILAAPGVVIDRPTKNVRGEWRHLAFVRVPFTPERHVDAIALAPHGGHHDVSLLGCRFENWRQVIEGQADGAGNQPDRFEFDGDPDAAWDWERIYNPGSVVVTAANQNDKGRRSQGAWWRGDGWRFTNLKARGIGWDLLGDPERRETDKFSQWLYGSQRATNTLIENCTVDGVSNNAVVYKGTGLWVRGCTFDRVVNGISIGTNEAPVYACSAVIEDVEFRRLIPLNWKDDPSLPDSEQVKADSGVAISLSNFDGVEIRRVRVTKSSEGRRAVLLMFNNGKSSSVSASGLLVEDSDAGPLDLAEVRNFRVPASGFDVRVRGTNATEKRVLVRNTVPDRAGDVIKGFVVDGQIARSR